MQWAEVGQSAAGLRRGQRRAGSAFLRDFLGRGSLPDSRGDLLFQFVPRFQAIGLVPRGRNDKLVYKMPARKKVRVLIADDQTLFRAGIRDLLNHDREIEVVGEAGNGTEAVTKAKKLQPDAVLMDINLPNLNGIEATRQIRKACPKTNVVILSSFEDQAHVMEAIQAGANGYLSKMLPPSEVVNALKALASNGVLLPQPLLNDLTARLKESRSASDSLTRAEMRVLALLGRGLTSKQIARELTVTLLTVKNHLYTMYMKLGVASRTEAVVSGIERGLISPEDAQGKRPR